MTDKEEDLKMKAAARPDSSNRSKRPRRNAVGGAHGGGPLDVQGKDDNYNYRWETDSGNRINLMKEFGYEVVEDKSITVNSKNAVESGSAHTVVVDKRSGEKGVLMRQPKEFHEEDRKIRAKAIDKTEESMFRNLKTEDSRYGEVGLTTSLAKESDD